MNEKTKNSYVTHYFFTQKEFDELLETPFDERKKKGLPVFNWEHCAKSFQYIPNELAMKYLMESSDCTREEDRKILKCKYNSDVYYFGVGLKESKKISLEKLFKLYQYGTWSVYTWCD